jgi:signal transduction histidine kinase
MDYECASQNIKNYEDNGLSYQAVILLELVKFQKPQILDQSVSKPSQINHSVSSLIEGYNELFKDDYSSIKAYKAFSKALNLSNNTSNNELTKFCIVSILEILRKEIFIGSSQFATYLNHFKELVNSKEDEIILTYFEVVFASKENENLNVADGYANKMNKLDSLFKGLEFGHSYFPFYAYEKGTQFKLNSEYIEASKWFKKAIDFCSKPHLNALKGTLYWQLSHNNFLMGDIKNADFFLRKSQDHSSGLRGLFYDHRLKAWIFEAKMQFDSAYYYMDSSVELEYKMGAKNNSLETALLSVENQTEKLKLDKLQLDNRRKTNQNYLVMAFSLLIIGGITAVFLQKNTTKKRQLAEKEALLKQERVENLLKEQELVSIDAMIEGQEKERQRVANELHDDLGSLMATIKLHFDNSKVSKKDSALQNAQKLLEEAYQKVRGMAHSKNSGVMSDQGLLPAIKKMAKVITETNALAVTVEDFGMGDRLENSLELNLFRMVQELVANTIKHAEATQVNIQLTQHEDNLNIIIEDNGKGFDRSKVDTSKTGMGLTTIEKRVEHLEGNFTVDSVLGKGTSILIDIPV